MSNAPHTDVVRRPSDLRGRIYVLAGVNGAAKSSVTGAAIRAVGGEYFNPDEATQRIMAANPGATLPQVASGGHDIPEAKIRERYQNSRVNLIRLLPRLTTVSAFDNTIAAPPAEGHRPDFRLLLRTERGGVREVAALETIPEWAKPIVMAAKPHQLRCSAGHISPSS